MTPTSGLIMVSIRSQILQWLVEGQLVNSYPISTSRRPPSCIEDSEGTPWGMHEIVEKIGDGNPLGMVYRGRISQGRLYNEFPTDQQRKNLITTRILRLRGLEKGVNAGIGLDSFDRYIYIHGTNHEDRIGTPASGGCVLMKNNDIVELYSQVEKGTMVWIDPEL